MKNYCYKKQFNITLPSVYLLLILSFFGFACLPPGITEDLYNENILLKRKMNTIKLYAPNDTSVNSGSYNDTIAKTYSNNKIQKNNYENRVSFSIPNEIHQETLISLFNDLKIFIETSSINAEIEVDTNSYPSYIDFYSTKLFGSARSRLESSELKKLFFELAFLIRSNPGFTNNIYIIEGHSDSLPLIRSSQDINHNLDLSVARAVSVMKYLSDYCGLSPEVLFIHGVGDKKPITSNDTSNGRAKNRYIRIYFIPFGFGNIKNNN